MLAMPYIHSPKMADEVVILRVLGIEQCRRGASVSVSLGRSWSAFQKTKLARERG